MPFDYKTYMKNFATVHRDILHDDSTHKRYFTDIDDIDPNNMPQGEVFMFCPDPGVRFAGQNIDSAVKRNYGEIYFCIPCKKDSPATEQAARLLCIEIAEQLQARIIKSRCEFEFNDFDFRETTIDPAGPLLTSANAHGAVMRIYIGHSQSLELDTSKFTDLS